MSILTKTCTLCKTLLPATSDFFPWTSKKKLAARCKGCIKKYYKKYRQNNVDYIREWHKKYRKEKDADIKKKKANYRKKNKEIIKERSRIYREKYDKEIRERKKLDYINNKEKYSKKMKEYHKKNGEHVRQKVKIWRKNNPERYAEIKAKSNRKRRAILKNIPTEPYTDKQVIDTYGTICYLCGFEIDFNAPRQTSKKGWENGFHIDHVIPISKNGPDTLKNVRPTHGKCNLTKWATV